MLRRFLISGFRFFFNNKLTAIICVLGLSVAMTLIIHMTLFVKNELSYDHFHQKHDRIYRILGKDFSPGQDPTLIALCQGQLPYYLKNIPEVESCLRIYDNGIVDIEYENNRFTKNHLLSADSTFFDLFSFKVLSGNPSEVLQDSKSIMICKSLSIKVFSTIDVIGKSIKIAGKDLSVGGVLDDVRANSHLKFDMLCGFNDPSLDNLVKHSGGEFYTYVLLRKNIDKEITLKKICDSYSALAADFWKDSERKLEGITQSLTDIELHSDNIIWDVPHGNIQNIYLATGLIIFILIIAVINFVNLFTVSAETRIKEAGVRKVSGASRFDMIKQYMGEAGFIALFSLLFAFYFTSFTLSYFNKFTGGNISVSELFNPGLLAGFILLSTIIGIVSGIYPALYLSRFSVDRMFKGVSSKGGHISPFIKGLVLSQFFIVTLLVSCMLIFYRQMNYVKNKDLGFNKEYVVAINGLNKNVFNNYNVIRDKLLQKNGILNVCLAQSITDETMSGQYASRTGTRQSEEILVNQTRTTQDFIKTFDITILYGRDFDNSFPTDKKNFIINETAIKALGFQGDAVGQMMVMNDTGYVLGVVKDFNFASLHNKVGPLVITFNDLKRGIIYVRLNPSFIHEGLEYISQAIKTVDPLYNLEYEFVDDSFNRMYLQESKINKMLFTTTIISIILALMGLVGLTSISILRRVKEIGIRKINGARVSEILVLLNMDFLKWVFAAFAAAIPVSLVVMMHWMKDFAFKAGISLWIFALSGITIFGITLLTVSCISWRAATRNPVEALRYE
ncbi:MAG: ABC transporter permease [Bacteroidia bacterium]|nr:ABC transporter permease [Bacteroidia bacterium]